MGRLLLLSVFFLLLLAQTELASYQTSILEEEIPEERSGEEEEPGEQKFPSRPKLKFKSGAEKRSAVGGCFTCTDKVQVESKVGSLQTKIGPTVTNCFSAHYFE